MQQAGIDDPGAVDDTERIGGGDDDAVRAKLLDNYSLEIGAGLGPFSGKAWRIGLMGHTATRMTVDLGLTALKDAMGRG